MFFKSIIFFLFALNYIQSQNKIINSSDSQSMTSMNDSGECSKLLTPSDSSVSQNNVINYEGQLSDKNVLRNTEVNRIVEIEEDVLMDLISFPLSRILLNCR